MKTTGCPSNFFASVYMPGHLPRQDGQSSSKNHRTTPLPLSDSAVSGGEFSHIAGSRGNNSLESAAPTEEAWSKHKAAAAASSVIEEQINRFIDKASIAKHHFDQRPSTLPF